ncbi:MAG TPA: hypothetical protein VFU24_14200 [Burkholderiales bacterium]|nr:hypothetical protein [Burkholderiales bacterium]
MIFRIAALGIGALAMYYFDPVSGQRRRDTLRDLAKGTARRARHRAHYMVAEARSAVERRKSERPEPDRRDPQQHWPLDINLNS